MVATVSTFLWREATAERDSREPHRGVSKNKSLLASRVHFYFLDELFWLLMLAHIHTHTHIQFTSFTRPPTAHSMSRFCKMFPNARLRMHPYTLTGASIGISAGGGGSGVSSHDTNGGDGANVLYTSACLINVKINWV